MSGAPLDEPNVLSLPSKNEYKLLQQITRAAHSTRVIRGQVLIIKIYFITVVIFGSPVVYVDALAGEWVPGPVSARTGDTRGP